MLVLVHLFCDPTEILSLIGGERLQVTQELGPFVDIIARRGKINGKDVVPKSSTCPLGANQLIHWESVYIFRFRWNFSWFVALDVSFGVFLFRRTWTTWIWHQVKNPKLRILCPKFSQIRNIRQHDFVKPCSLRFGVRGPIWVLQPISLPELSADREGTS